MARPTRDITGQRFGRLLILRKASSDGPTLWECRCDCGTVTVKQAALILDGRTISCGCRKRETREAQVAANTTHGLTHTRVFRIWNGMKNRCGNPNQPHYERYGARGIRVCERWQTFANFYEDMGEPPTDRHTIDRIDGNLGYEPGNCRWATYMEQAKNKRRPVKVSLSEDDVRAIRATDKAVSNGALGRKYGVTPDAIRKARLGLTWSHIT